MNQQDRFLLKDVYGLDYKEQNKASKLVRTGWFTLDTAAKHILKDKAKPH